MGSLSATPDHLWVVKDKNGNVYTETTDFIYCNWRSFADKKNRVYLPQPWEDVNGPNDTYIVSIKKVYGEKSKNFWCYELDTDQKMFFIMPKRGKVKSAIANAWWEKSAGRLWCIEHGAPENVKPGFFVHNCQSRIGCGRLQGMASMMLFGSTVGTSINGAIQGAGMISANGILYNIQYFYEEVKWIKAWYKKCGFSDKGYCTAGSYPQVKVVREPDEQVNPSAEELDSVFDFQPETAVFEYDDELRAEVQRGEDQEFE